MTKRIRKLPKRAHPTAHNFQSLEGQKFGRLRVLWPTQTGKAGLEYLCRCRCGTYKEIAAQSLRKGLTTSCGCYRKEVSAQAWRERNHKDLPGYTAAHVRLYREFGKASDHACTNCGREAQQWAYLGGDPNELTKEVTNKFFGNKMREIRYSLDPNYYTTLCISCHVKFDKGLINVKVPSRA